MSTFETLDTSPTWSLVADTGADVADQAAPRPLPRLILALECSRLLAPGRRLMLDTIDHVLVARGATARIERAGRAAMIIVTDAEASRRHLTIRRSEQGWQVTDLGSRNGTVVNGEHVQTATLAGGDLVEAGGAMLVFADDGSRGGEPEEREPVEPPAAEPPPPQGVTSPAPGIAYRTLSIELERRFRQIQKIAPSEVPILVRGETGTGKELVARAIHDASGRRGPFVPVNCGALPRDLIESELFGHRRGAFSGASDDSEGLIRRAHRGTLFLDEIAELPLDSQVALLRVLADGEVRPVGASEPEQVNVRIVAATHQDLVRRIGEGTFRQDLYGRIAGFEITLPALRDRRADIPALAEHFLGKLADEHQRRIGRISSGALDLLMQYPWPGNVRELENVIERAVVVCDGAVIQEQHLPAALQEEAAPRGEQLTLARAVERLERQMVEEALRNEGGSIVAAARVLGTTERIVRYKARRLGIDASRYRR